MTIPSGSRLLLAFGAANRDPEVFEDPDTYRADRNPRNHIAFGYGVHMCIGATLSRMEGQAVLRELTSQASAIAAAGSATWSTNSSLRGHHLSADSADTRAVMNEDCPRNRCVNQRVIGDGGSQLGAPRQSVGLAAVDRGTPRSVVTPVVSDGWVW